LILVSTSIRFSSRTEGLSSNQPTRPFFMVVGKYLRASMDT
jgi:hypothetical protein